MTTTNCALAAERLQQAQATQKEIARLQEQVGRLEQEWRTTRTGVDEAQVARKRAELRRDGESTQRTIDGLVRRQAELSEQARTIADDHGALLRRYQQKSDELATVGDDAGRGEVERELMGLLRERFVYERDEKLLVKANELFAGILERAGEVLVREEHVRVQTTAGPKTIKASEMGKGGNPNVGVTVVGAGSRIPKEKARQLGIID